MSALAKGDFPARRFDSDVLIPQRMTTIDAVHNVCEPPGDQ
jgi:hypothetical protein